MDNNKGKVTGIGGVFFYTDNTEALKKWYQENLGINFNEWGGVSFDNSKTANNHLEWMAFPKESNHFKPSNKNFMINYKVENIEQLYNQLKENNVEILDEIKDYDYGKFLHILDLEGNKIELWEPK